MSLQDIKQRFYAMRNGVVASALRRGGCPHGVVFGLLLPQIVEIARDFEPSAELAEELWANQTCRESVLLAPMLYPPQEMTEVKALTWLSQAQWTEDIDILCNRLLKRLPFALSLAKLLAEKPESLMRYAAMRLYLGILGLGPSATRHTECGCYVAYKGGKKTDGSSCIDDAAALAERELKGSEKWLQGIANSLREECRFNGI